MSDKSLFCKSFHAVDTYSGPGLMKDGQVIQIIDPGYPNKVVMTQEYYFSLCARLEKAEGTTKRTEYNSAKLFKEVAKVVKKVRKSVKKK